ncbi:hypothetical protein CHI06_10030 [Bacillus sp. 7884-1]|nr:hypothetical protein CHI06_10030 [Bacillus sp. 7884-1]
MDGLTSIGNRRHFDEVLNKEWTRLTSTESPLTLLMFELTTLKSTTILTVTLLVTSACKTFHLP